MLTLNIYNSVVTIVQPDGPKNLELLNLINQKLDIMSQNVEDLKKEVAESKTVTESAITLLQGLKTRLDEAIGDDNALRQLSADLDAQSNALAAAITTNTPSSEEGTEEKTSL